MLNSIDIISYPLIVDAETGIHQHGTAKYHMQSKDMFGIALLTLQH